MKKGWIFAGVGVGLLGFGLYKYFQIQAKLLKDYQYQIVKIKPVKLTITEATFEIVMRFTSKSSIEAKIKALYLDVIVEGVNVGYVKDVNEFIIPANGSADIPLTISFSPKKVLPNLVTVILSGTRKKDLNFQLVGEVDVHSGFFKKVIRVDYKDVISAYI
jgi:LEA14-like dessication related protein